VLGLTALTSLSQQWNTYVWLAVAVVVMEAVLGQAVFYPPQVFLWQ
jgi:hypothetical protein